MLPCLLDDLTAILAFIDKDSDTQPPFGRYDKFCTKLITLIPRSYSYLFLAQFRKQLDQKPQSQQESHSAEEDLDNFFRSITTGPLPKLTLD